METRWRWTVIGAIAPAAWGSNYFITRHALPVDAALWGAVIRAFPAGLLLLCVRPRLPHGSWWWRSVVLGSVNMGAFFALVYLAGQLLPTATASMVMSLAPLVMMAFGWWLLSERPTSTLLVGIGLGTVGVVLLLSGSAGAPSPVGLAASLGALVLSGAGHILTKRWGRGTDVLAATSWQLIAGGLVTAPFALLLEGAPPALSPTAVLGFAYVSVIATAVAFVAWFTALHRLPAATVGLIGLLNPVTGTLLGVLAAGETLTAVQVLGIAIVLAGLLLGQRQRPSASADTTAKTVSR
jgi:probable blue pigment (indigoidine) exporter